MSSRIQSYIHDFNVSVENFQKFRAEASENEINCNLSLVYSSKDKLALSPDSIENCRFYINLHVLLEYLDSKSDTVWTCILILQHAIKNNEVREAILNQFRFLQPLSKILLKIDSPEKIKSLLTLIQDLTYGIKITLEEKFIEYLLNFLIQYINDDSHNLGNISLSVLINLCYKNTTIIFLLLRTIDLPSFIKKISTYGIFGSKMQVILDIHSGIPNIKYLHYFIKQCFLEIEESLSNWNSVQLKHIMEFLIDKENSELLNIAVKEYNEYSEDIEKLIKHLNKEELQPTEIDDEQKSKNQAICLSLIFELINNIFKFDSSLQSIQTQIFDLAIRWLKLKWTKVKALEIITTILEKTENNCKTFHSSLNEILPNLVKFSESIDANSEQLVAFFKLLLVLLNKQSTRNLVISIVKESYFDKQFSSLFAIRSDSLNHKKFTTHDLSRYLYCLMILIEFSNVAEDIWMDKITELFKMKQIQYVIAKSLICGDVDLCNIIFKITKIENFPSDFISNEIGKLIPNLKAEILAKDCNSGLIVSEPEKIAFSLRNLCDCGRLNFSKETELRLNELISHIFESKMNGEFNNLATSELIELFNYKIHSFSNTEKNLTKRLEDASNEITNLSHRISLLSRELSLYHDKNLKLNLAQEGLELENSTLIKQRDKLKESLNVLIKDFNAEQSKLKVYKRDLENCRHEKEDLQQELSKHMERETSNLKKHEAKVSELTQSIQTLKKNLKLCDETSKENKRLLEEKEKENARLIKIINDLKEMNAKSENVIKHVQAQLIEKSEKIKQYEEELRETEELRNTIITLMKPKRKNNSVAENK